MKEPFSIMPGGDITCTVALAGKENMFSYAFVREELLNLMKEVDQH